MTASARRQPRAPNRAAVGVLAIALAITGTGFAVWLRGCGSACVDGLVIETLFKSLAATTAAVLAGATLGKALAAARGGGWPRLRPSLALVLVSLALGLLSATPVAASWHDGCNYHDGRLPLLSAPQVWFGEPERAQLVYDDIQSLMSCVPVS